ncbi:phosphotransferase family protein [Paenibacillus sepulcri]|uniref:Phosphotransferase n=1 Tax=Paenibacillus sepulcri TaxID=359917 RepID=A0ABS7C7J3_9BACL|nr:phosphotransferase [Paenibacillus sepulcri]
MEAEPKLPEGVMLPDGTLNSELISRREIIYRGMNGQAVERIYILPGQSYIYKPLTNDDQWGKEKWVYDHILPSLPHIYPRMLLSSFNLQTGRHTIIFEDLGHLEHGFREPVAVELARQVAGLHSLSTDHLFHAPLRGPKPPIEAIVGELLRDQAETIEALSDVSIPRMRLETLYEAMEQTVFPDLRVVSHGDLHSGNYALAAGRLVVLDWEHTHLNSPLWDLYHMIDMSHPLFPKRMTADSRNAILQAYLEAAEGRGYLSGINAAAFIREYMLFASIFSIWMLRLIQGDLARDDDRWPRAQLEQQLEETTASLEQCADWL